MTSLRFASVSIELCALGLTFGCTADAPDAPQSAAAPRDAEARVAELRDRFVVTPAHRGWIDRGRARVRDAIADAATRHPTIGAGVVARFAPPLGGRVRAELAPAGKRGVLRSATVELPTRADGLARLRDDTSGVEVTFALEGAAPADLATTRDGIAVYPRALEGADVIHRVHAEGTEDFVAFEARPAREELVYRVDVSRVPGVRLVADVLELVDARGTPALRVAPPFVVADAAHGGAVTPAHLAIEGCAYDANPAPPWRRSVTPPGAPTCTLRVTWSGAVYPALVDPSWTATGNLITPRYSHAASKLASGDTLITGGYSASAELSSAELFDGVSVFAATGSMTTPRSDHTSTLLPSGAVLIAGGASTASAERFDGTSTFALLPAMVGVRSQHTATLLSAGHVLLAGGIDGSGNSRGDAEIFDGSTFAATGFMTEPRNGHTATLLTSGQVLITGGDGLNGTLSDAELFDGASFTATGSMATARVYHTATLVGSGEVLIAGGFRVSTAELFDGASTFTATGSMTAARYGQTATLLPSGQVLVAGGRSETAAFLSSAELFDGSASFTATGFMRSPRAYHTATLLDSGAVLVAGGEASVGSTAEAERFALALAGATCADPGECQSGLCADGVCCVAACPNGGVCQGCVAGTGACATLTNVDDPDNCTGAMTCGPTGTCLLKTGQPSIVGAACVSGFASDGVCCDAACGASCDVCARALGATSDGACTTAPVGYAGSPACATGYACDGANTVCPTACASDGACAAGDYCASSGVCAPSLGLGAACDPATACKSSPCRACASGSCVDGVCCGASSCPGCQACAAALQAPGGTSGVCSDAIAGTDPHDDCEPDQGFPANCGGDGNCDGSGACRVHAPVTVSCGPTTCDGDLAVGHLCDGLGHCSASLGQPCSPFACTQGQCASSCTTDADCADATYTCNAAHTCVERAPRGMPCANDDACEAGTVCANNVCCDQPCDGTCEACDLADHPGTCTPTPPGPPRAGKPICDGAPGCPGSCDGHSTGCAFPVGHACATSCSQGEETDSLCDATGACRQGAPMTCAGGLQCEGDVMCKSRCVTDADCVTGLSCDKGVCSPGRRCVDDDAYSQGPNGKIECSPYVCNESSNACFEECTTVSECAAGFLCDQSRHCVAPAPPSAAAESSSSGCAFGLADESCGFAALATLAAALASRRRRAASARRSRRGA